MYRQKHGSWSKTRNIPGLLDHKQSITTKHSPMLSGLGSSNSTVTENLSIEIKERGISTQPLLVPVCSTLSKPQVRVDVSQQVSVRIEENIFQIGCIVAKME